MFREISENSLKFSFLKVRIPHFKRVGFICFDENPLKNDEKWFLFQLKALFVIKIFKFCPELFGHVGKRLDR